MNHISPLDTVSSVSATNGKVSWIDTVGGHYSINTLDTNFNTTTVVYDNLVIPAPDILSQFGLGGQAFIYTCFEKQGILWGLCFDMNEYNDSLANNFQYLGQDCFFLYDFNNSIRKYFTFLNSTGWLTPLKFDFTSRMFMNNDTMVVTMTNSNGGGI